MFRCLLLKWKVQGEQCFIKVIAKNQTAHRRHNDNEVNFFIFLDVKAISVTVAHSFALKGYLVYAEGILKIFYRFEKTLTLEISL